MMRNRRRLLLAAGGTAVLGACSFSLEHGLLSVFETRRFFDRQGSAASARLPRAG